MERGFRINQGRHVFQRTLRTFLTSASEDVSPRIQALIADTATELEELNERIPHLGQRHRSHASAKKPTT